MSNDSPWAGKRHSVSAHIGAGLYERSEARTTERNAHRPRTLSTKAGEIELGIPKLRKGSFFPSILEPPRRVDQALYAVVTEAYVQGVSTRAVDDLVQALGIGTGVSRSEVSRIYARVDEHVAAFRERRLDHAAFRFIYLDATYLHVRDDHHVVSKAVVIATGVSGQGLREVLGFGVGDSEDELFWREFLHQPAQTRPVGGAQRLARLTATGATQRDGRPFGRPP